MTIPPPRAGSSMLARIGVWLWHELRVGAAISLIASRRNK